MGEVHLLREREKGRLTTTPNDLSPRAGHTRRYGDGEQQGERFTRRSES